MIGLPTQYFEELVYDADARPFFRETWPQSVFEDASDFIHEGRFRVMIPGASSDDCYPLILHEGWSGACLAFEIALRLPESRDVVHRWIDAARALQAAEPTTGV